MPPKYNYGGQALIEGVLMRGRDAIAVALRHPDGRIVWATERLDSGFHGSRWSRFPFVRGLVVLYETLVVGTRWLIRSANVAAEEIQIREAREAAEAEALQATAEEPAVGEADLAPTAATGDAAPMPVPPAAAGATATATDAGTLEEDDETAPYVVQEAALGKGTIAIMLGVTFLIAVGVFFLLPLAIASVVAQNVENEIVQHLIEGVVRVVIFLGYLAIIGRTPDIRRVFQYHGAEHMTIHALEGGNPLTVEEIRKYPTAHQRCGTEFLVVVILLSIIAFSLVGRQEPLVMIASRVLLIPVIASIGYEILRFGARHRRNPIVKVLLYPGILVQMITTKQPTDDMIEVAIASMEQVLIADGESVPLGSLVQKRAPMTIGGQPVMAEPMRQADVEPPAA
jgi:uncharacterized protein YqhQ